MTEYEYADAIVLSPKLVDFTPLKVGNTDLLQVNFHTPNFGAVVLPLNRTMVEQLRDMLGIYLEQLDTLGARG